MAIDTREKRASVLGVARPWYRSKLPGTIDEAWRLASGNVYAGNALSPSVDGVFAPTTALTGLSDLDISLAAVYDLDIELIGLIPND